MNKIFSKILSTITAGAVTIFASSGSLQAVVNEIRANAAENEMIYGDINNDGNIDSFDIVTIRQILNFSNTSEAYKAADLNGNNIVDAADLYLLQSYVIGKIDSFPIETIEINNSIDRTLALYDGEHYELALTTEMFYTAYSLKTPLNIYDYLCNNIRTEFYPNSRKGAIGTFELYGGNDVDCASLLIAMLNCVGISSRYVTGNITLPIDTAMNLTGAHDANSALNILKFWDNNATLSSDNSSISLAHTWVSSMIDGKEYNLDCSFKQYSYQDTIFDSINEQYDFKDENLNINDVIDEQYTFQTKGYLVDKQIITVNNSQLPTNLPYTNEPTGGYDYVTSEISDTVTFTLPGNKGITFLSSQLYNAKITLQYEVNRRFVDDEDLGPWYLSSVTEGETIYELMDDYRKDSQLKTDGAAYGDMELVLRINGQKYRIGNPECLRKLQNITVKINTMGQEVEYEKECLVGGTYSVILDYQNMASYKMTDDIKEIDALKNSVNKSNLFKTDNMGRLLELIGDTYYSEFDVFNNMIAEQSDVYLTRGLSVIFAGFEPSITVPETPITPTDYTVNEDGAIVIDVIANCYNMVSRNSDSDTELNAKRTSGLMSSQLESSVLDQMFDIQSVSTSNILRYAGKNSIPIHYISNYNKSELDSLSINDNAKGKINERIAKGYIITVPETDITINNWTGCGYISYDAEDGFSEYLLSRKTTTFGGCTSSNVKLQEMVAMFFSTTALLSAASWASNAIMAISFPAELTLAAFGVFGFTLLVAAVAVTMFLAAIAMETYTIQLIERIEAGDNEALKELKLNNVLDVGMSAMSIAGSLASRACNSCYKEARSIEKTEKYGSKVVEGAAKHSNDMADAFRTADKLKEKGLSKAATNSSLKYGDTVLDIFNRTKNPDKLVNSINNSKNIDDTMAFIAKRGDSGASIVEKYGKSLYENNFSEEEFLALRRKNWENLAKDNPDKIALMKNVRESIPSPDKNTLMSKVIPQSDFNSYMSGDYYEVGGFVTKADDVSDFKSYDDFYNNLGLDYSGSKFKPDTDDCMYAIRFKSDSVEGGIHIPYGESFGGTASSSKNPLPFTGNGFAGGEGIDILTPEYEFNNYSEIMDGAEMYRIDKNGTQTLVAIYDSTEINPKSKTGYGKFVKLGD